MSLAKITRRKFLTVATAVGAALGAVPFLKARAQAVPTTAAQGASIELWLLGTGRGQIDPSIYYEALKAVGAQPSAVV